MKTPVFIFAATGRDGPEQGRAGEDGNEAEDVIRADVSRDPP
jgi:hypothetical protein